MRELYFVRHGESLWKSHVKVPIKNMPKGCQQKADAPSLYPYVPLDQSGQLDGQLIQIVSVKLGRAPSFRPCRNPEHFAGA